MEPPTVTIIDDSMLLQGGMGVKLVPCDFHYLAMPLRTFLGYRMITRVRNVTRSCFTCHSRPTTPLQTVVSPRQLLMRYNAIMYGG